MMRAPALMAGMRFGHQAQKWNACDENLTSIAHLASASLVGCSWCPGFSYFMAGKR